MTIDAESFIDAATHLCAVAGRLGAGAAIALHRASGPVGLSVDTYVDATDDIRRWMLTDEAWRINPMLIELRRQLAILGPEIFDAPASVALVEKKGYVGAARKRHVGMPMLGPAGWFGLTTFAVDGEPSAELERQLGMLTTELSVWCTARGISTLPDVRPIAPRQHEVATLAADGRTNPEIADALGISINTVKLRLKQIFERFGVDNRTELANLLRRLAPLEGVPPDITRRGAVTITRDAMTCADRALAGDGVAR